MTQQLITSLEQDHLSLNLMVKPGFYENIRSNDVIALRDLLFNSNVQLSQSVRLAIMAIILIGHSDQLTPQQHRLLSEELGKSIKTSNYKNVVAALLIRIPNFTSFKNVIPHLEPVLAPVSLLMDLSSKLKDSSSNLYDKQISKYRVEWCALSASQQLTVAGLTLLNEQLCKNEGTLDLYSFESRLERQTNYLLERIAHLGSLKLDINRLTQSLENLITVRNIDFSNTSEQTKRNCIECRQKIIVSALSVLSALVGRMGRRLIRKYGFLLSIHEYCYTNLTSPSILLHVLDLTTRILETFGNGSLPLEDILFNSPYSLIALLQYILKRKQPNITPKEEQHYRKQKASTRQKTDKASLSFNHTQNSYETPLSSVTPLEQQQIILKCLHIYKIFYQLPHTGQQASALVQLIDYNEGRLTKASKRLYESIKELIFPKSIVFGRDVDHVYEQLCEQRVQRRKNKNAIHHTIEIAFASTERPAHIKQLLEIKKAASQDLQIGEHTSMEGWNTTKKPQWGSSNIKPATQMKPEEPSEMFYSFHDSRISKQKDQDNGDEYILTPSFQ